MAEDSVDPAAVTQILMGDDPDVEFGHHHVRQHTHEIVLADRHLRHPDPETRAHGRKLRRMAVGAQPEAERVVQSFLQLPRKNPIRRRSVRADQRVRCKIRRRDRRAVPVQIGRGGEKPERDAPDLFRHQRILARAVHPDRDIRLLTQKIGAVVAQHQFEFECRMTLTQREQQRRHYLDADKLRHADPHRSGDLAASAGCRAVEGVRRETHAPDMDRQFPRLVRREQPVHAAREERLADRMFQSLDPMADGRLGQAERPRCRRQAACVEDRKEGPLIFPVRKDDAHFFSMSGLHVFVNFHYRRGTAIFHDHMERSVMPKTILVLGATGGIGGEVARVMLQRGWEVRAMVRDPARAASGWNGGPAPQWVRGDAMRREDVVKAANGATAILHGVNPPGYRHWDTMVLPMIDNTIAAAKAAGGARIMLPGTIYNYDAAASPVIDEMTLQTSRGRKGMIRTELERRLAEAAPDVLSLVVRAGDYFGPGVRQSWFAQAMAKPPLTRIFDPGRPGIGHSWTYVPDLAEAMARLIELPSGTLAPAERVQFGGFWDADGTAMIAAIRRASGRPDLPVWRFPWWLMRALFPFGGFPREVMEMRPYWRHPVRLDNTRLVRLIGTEPQTAIDQAVAEAL